MFLKSLIFEVLYFLKMCPIFVGSVHNFGKSDDENISEKVFISNRCISVLMSNLIKKSWMDSNVGVWWLHWVVGSILVATRTKGSIRWCQNPDHTGVFWQKQKWSEFHSEFAFWIQARMSLIWHCLRSLVIF